MIKDCLVDLRNKKTYYFPFPSRTDLFVVKKLDNNHIAYLNPNSSGVFAKTFIPKGTSLGFYGGTIIPFTDYNINNEYVLEVKTKHQKFCIDARLTGNDFRYVNCYNLIADEPNVDIELLHIILKPLYLLFIIKNLQKKEKVLIMTNKKNL
jgi:hypothetical protein